MIVEQIEFAAGVSTDRLAQFICAFECNCVNYAIKLKRIPIADIKNDDIVFLPEEKIYWTIYIKPCDFSIAEKCTSKLEKYSNENEQLVTFCLRPSCQAEKSYDYFPEIKLWMPLDE